MTPPDRTRVHVDARGVVQGVGFRPFVFRAARERGLTGWVRNDSGGVKIQVEGPAGEVASFLDALLEDAPPLADVQSVISQEIELRHDPDFVIRESAAIEGAATLVSPDVATCGDCLRELLDPRDRRFRYPFINCTNCGPRFTIVEDVPYDRPNTTMRTFAMCERCVGEYHDPTDRRFHAQPNACPACGPRVWLAHADGSRVAEDAAITRAIELLADGRTLAAKGLGGFHLAADPANDAAVTRLRERKGREQKPLAVMCRSVDVVASFCRVSAQERECLLSPQRPIVLLRRYGDSPWSAAVAPSSQYLGTMLPYTPLHNLLLTGRLPALIMTSGNLSDEPICIDNTDAVERLQGVADAFLLHDRDICFRADDSLCRVDLGRPIQVRRSRGFAPLPVRLPTDGPPVLAVGAELKNTVCLARGSQAFVSQHIGDLKNVESLLFLRKTAEHFERVFDARPRVIAHDLHPDYLSTRYAQERLASDPSLELVAVQHHFAHVASCIAENRVEGQVIGIAFDGTGLGTDRAIWGGEFLLADLRGFTRVAHLKYVPLPGGDAAVRHPPRMAVAHLAAAFPDDWRAWASRLLPDVSDEEAGVVHALLSKRLNSPATSSMGRLFDAVSALCGIASQNTYEGQAAIELEAALDESETGAYAFGIQDADDAVLVDAASVVRRVAGDLGAGVAPGRVSARFHRAVVGMIVAVCGRLRERYNVERVCLSGGVFQNQHLVEWTAPALSSHGFDVHTHRLVPANDGGLSFGQAAAARASLLAETRP